MILEIKEEINYFWLGVSERQCGIMTCLKSSDLYANSISSDY